MFVKNEKKNGSTYFVTFPTEESLKNNDALHNARGSFVLIYIYTLQWYKTSVMA